MGSERDRSHSGAADRNVVMTDHNANVTDYVGVQQLHP